MSLVRQSGAGGDFHPFRPLLHCHNNFVAIKTCGNRKHDECDMYTYNVFPEKKKKKGTIQKRSEYLYFHTGGGLSFVLGPWQNAC